MPVKKYPLDFDALQKGDTISVDQLEDILGLKWTDEQFPLKVLSLRERIEKELLDRNCPVTTRIQQGQIIICDDRMASKYNAQITEQGYRMIRKSHRRNLAVDITDFDDAEKKSHERRLLISGAMSAACRVVRRQPQLAATLRKTPMIGNGDGKKT